ncbi:P-loop containing nucleoside triphosphate hydrolase protein, partial [Pluteus cervinus]
ARPALPALVALPALQPFSPRVSKSPHNPKPYVDITGWNWEDYTEYRFEIFALTERRARGFGQSGDFTLSEVSISLQKNELPYARFEWVEVPIQTFQDHESTRDFEAMLSAAMKKVSDQCVAEVQVRIKECVAEGLAQCFYKLGIPLVQSPRDSTAERPDIPRDMPFVDLESAGCSDTQRPDDPTHTFAGFATSQPPTPSAEELLDLALGKQGSTFRNSMQKTIVEQAMKGDESFVAVMPTGSGKSLTYFIPSLMLDNGYTFVVLPQVSLLHDVKRRAQESSIEEVHIWTAEDNNPGTARLVLIALESITSSAFRTFFNLNGKRVRRIVFDEAHQIITEADFREEFSQIRELAGYAVQKIYLTATLPPSDFTSFCNAIGYAHCLRLHRMCSDRPNIAYHFTSPTKNGGESKLLDEVEILAKVLSAGMKTDERGIIFVRSRDVADELSAKLKHGRYHAGMGGESRQTEQDKWARGGHQWMVATSGFLHGIDIPSVRYAIFAGKPFKYSDLVQGGGRLARGGGFGDVVVFHEGKRGYKAGEPSHHVDELEGLLNSNQCLRSAMTHLMDGEGVMCGASALHRPCGNCDPKSQLAMLIASLGAQIQAQANTKPAQLKLVRASNAGSVSNRATSEAIDRTNPLKRKASVEMERPTPLTVNPGQRTVQSISGLSFAETRPVRGLPVASKPISPGMVTAVQKAKPATVPTLSRGRSSATSETPSQSSSGPSRFTPGLSRGSSVSGAGWTTGSSSMSLDIDAAIFKVKSTGLNERARHLSDILDGLKKNCPICLLWQSIPVERTKTHTFFISCRPDGISLPNANDWMDLRRKMKFAVGHCFTCGFPVRGHLRPSSHPDNTDKDKCPYPSCVAAVFWFAFVTPQIWSELQECWSPPKIDNVEDLAEWMTGRIDQDHFYRGLEIFMWIWDKFVT